MTPPPLAVELAAASVAPGTLVATAPRGLVAALADGSQLVRPRIAVMAPAMAGGLSLGR